MFMDYNQSSLIKSYLNFKEVLYSFGYDINYFRLQLEALFNESTCVANCYFPVSSYLYK